MDKNVKNKGAYENIPPSQKTYPRISFSSSENSLESIIICHDESTMLKLLRRKEDIEVLSNLERAYENIPPSRKTYPRIPFSSSENSLESIICYDTIRDASQDESTTPRQPWSKEEIEAALSNLPGGDIAFSLISTLHGHALQKVLKEFQSVTLNKNEDNISLATSADEIEQNTILVDENRAEAMTLGQLLAEWPDTCLLISSWLGHVEIVEALLEKGVQVSISDNDGRTPLHLAACTTSTKIVEELLKYGADPCKWDFEEKCTPLHCAAAVGCVATVKCLIRSGANVNAERSPLYYAVLNNAVDCVEALLQAGACPNNPQMLLHVAVTLGNVDCIKLLLERGANVTIKIGIKKSTPLHLAAEKGNAECTKLLLDAGGKTDCEIKNSNGQTAMHLATIAKSVETIKELIRFGANVDEEDNEGRTPLHIAVLSARKSSELIEILIQAGASVNKADKCGYTPLHIAASLGNVHCIKLLLDHGANVTVKMGIMKSTPLHLAAEKGNAECTKLLLDAGARTETKNSSGQTAMHLATLAESVETIKELIRFGASVNAEDNEGRTPLYATVASGRENCELVKTLIQAGASVNKANKCGYTPLHIAALNESSHTVAMLLSNDGDVTARTKDGVTALSFIVRRTPEALSQLVTRLDQAVSLNDHELGDMDCKMRVDFRPLVPLNCRNETELMLCLVEVGQGHILKHPLCKSFLHLKWKCIRKFFVLSLLLRLIFVAFFTGFVYARYLKNDVNLSKVLFWPVLIITCLSASKEIFQITYNIYFYTKRWENWLQWSVIVASSIIMIALWNQDDPSPWQHHVAAVGILLVWIELMIVIGYFPMFGLYVQMFTRVSINFLKCLSAYFCLLIGFSLSFNALFYEHKSFTDPLISLLKTVIMMSGELDFENIFFKEDKDDKDKVVPLEYPGTAHVILLCFVILVTVILMNLMVGLAVTDIQNVRRHASVSYLERLVHHAEVINRFENMLFSMLIDYTHAFKIIQMCRENTQLLYSPARSVLHIQPNDPREKRLPQKLIQSLYCLASQKKRGASPGDAPLPQNVAANDMRLNTTSSSDSSQQQLDELVTELKKCSYDVAELKECFHDISIRLNNLTKKIESIAREQI